MISKIFLPTFLMGLLISTLVSEPGMEGIEVEGDGAAHDTFTIQEDENLQKRLQNLAKQRGSSFSKPESRADSLVFVRLSNQFIKRQLSRERAGETKGYIQSIKDHAYSKERIAAYSTDGKTKYSISWGSWENSQGSLDKSMLTGFLYTNKDFPLFYPRVLDAYKNDRISVRYPSDSRAEFRFPRGKITGYIILTQIDGKRTPVIVSAKNLDLKMDSWAQDALDAAFFKFFVYDHQKEILTTSEIHTFQISMTDLLKTLRQVRNAIYRTYRTGRENWYEQEDGVYIDYDKQWRDADDYRYKDALSKKLAQVDSKLKGDNTRKHVALIFGRNRVKDAYVDSVHEMGYALGRVSSKGWQEMKHDLTPSTAVLEPFTKARNGINGLVKVVREEEPKHKARLQSHLKETGLVTMGFLDYSETTAFDEGRR
ncbi:hypothetical protein HOF92_01950 [bacterium]|jgi:hypothetical protein|nr:hypothetical protein [bacterium]